MLLLIEEVEIDLISNEELDLGGSLLLLQSIEPRPSNNGRRIVEKFRILE
jgi:hypothetical protein